MFSASFFLPVFSLVLTASSAPVQQQPTTKLVKSLVKVVKPMMGAPSPIMKPVPSSVVNPNHFSVPVSSSLHLSSVESHPMIAPQYPFPLVHHGDISSDIQLSPSHLDDGIVYNGLPPTVMTGIQSDLPILVDGQVASMGTSLGSSLGTSMGGNLPIVKEVSMTDKMFPWYKKIRTSISSGTSKIKSILPGNPFKKLFGRNEEETVSKEYVTHEEAPIISKEKNNILSEAKKAVVKAAEVGAAKLTKLVGENSKHLVGENAKNFIGENAKKLVGEDTKKFFGEDAKKFVGENAKKLVGENAKKLVGPSILEASVKVKHPMIGKQSAKVKLFTA